MAAATEITAIRFSPSDHFHLTTTSTSYKASSKSAFLNIFPHSVSKTRKYSPLRASKPQREQEEISMTKDGNGPFNDQILFPTLYFNCSISSVRSISDSMKLKQDGLNYLLKLGAGSFAGAVIIKYGSILFPEITRPNIIEALVIISAPVAVAVVLLWKQSRQEQ